MKNTKNTYEMIESIVEENKNLTPKEILEILNQEAEKGTFGKEYQENAWDLEDELRDVIFEIAQDTGDEILEDLEKEHKIDISREEKDSLRESIYMHFDEWDEKISDFYKIYKDWSWEYQEELVIEALSE